MRYCSCGVCKLRPIWCLIAAIIGLALLYFVYRDWFSGVSESNALSSTINTGVFLATMAAAFSAAKAAKATERTVKEQEAQDKVTLWRSLSEEFDHKMNEYRRACGKEYASVRFLLETYVPVMDFFETLAHLVRHGRLPELARHTFWHCFDAYYRACGENLLAEVQIGGDPSIYEDCVWLHKTWGDDPTLAHAREMDEFFKSEASRALIR